MTDGIALSEHILPRFVEFLDFEGVLHLDNGLSREAFQEADIFEELDNLVFLFLLKAFQVMVVVAFLNREEDRVSSCSN